METVDDRHPLHAPLSRTRGSNLRFLIWAILAALAVRLVVVGFAYKGFLVPERDHWLFGFEIGKIARSIVLGHGFGNPYYGGTTGPTAEIAPVMPYVMAGVFWLFGIYTKASAIVMLSLNSLFSALTCIPIFFVAKKSFGIRVARWAAWGWAFFPYAIYFSADSMWDHALVTLLLTCIFWAALSLSDSSRIRDWAGFGLLCGFSALVNPIVLGVAPFLGAWACYCLYKNQRAWLAGAVAACVLTCGVIAPWLVRNYEVFHRPVFLKDNLPLELCVGNVGNSLHWWNGLLHPSGSNAELMAYQRLGEQAYMAWKWKDARDYIVAHPGIFTWRSVRRFVYVWTGYWSFNSEYRREEPFDLPDIPFRTALTALTVFALVQMFRRDPTGGIPYALLLIFFPLVYYVTHPEIAYRHPIDPEMLILAVCALPGRARRASYQLTLRLEEADRARTRDLV